MAVYKQTGKKPAQLEAQGDPPDGMFYLFRWFCELRHPFSYAELHHWAELTNRRLRGWEVEVLSHLDHLRNSRD